MFNLMIYCNNRLLHISQSFHFEIQMFYFQEHHLANFKSYDIHVHVHVLFMTIDSFDRTLIRSHKFLQRCLRYMIQP